MSFFSSRFKKVKVLVHWSSKHKNTHWLIKCNNSFHAFLKSRKSKFLVTDCLQLHRCVSSECCLDWLPTTSQMCVFRMLPRMAEHKFYGIAHRSMNPIHDACAQNLIPSQFAHLLLPYVPSYGVLEYKNNIEDSFIKNLQSKIFNYYNINFMYQFFQYLYLFHLFIK